MGLIDFLLNLACLCLWIGFRASWFPAGPEAASVSLRSTLRRADAPDRRRWSWLIALAAVLFSRAYLYSQLGGAVNWTPQLQLGVIVVNLRVDSLSAALGCSWLGFAAFWLVFHFWLVLFSLVNGPAPPHDPVQRLVRLHLGWVDRLPSVAKFAAALAAVAVAWWLAHGALAGAGAIPAAAGSRVWLQGLVLGGGAVLSWKIPIVAVLSASVVSSYIYFGEAAVWKWVESSAKHLLGPLHRAPLRAGRVDFAPVAGMALVWLAAHYAERWLTDLFQKLVA
ncbi:MAG: hypothetical protein FJ386_06710 [Verrucomicrobia bacterium]|nr:hypothetical protein [Verrucomicrobiota bacterium]